ncbi:hypothetical protein RRV45_15095 [Bacillus sp. DTU_2020_1000418_1_SI_GHA_SEK_038]|uniref:hypothetical protein n=1 Tax=Bacillus sp. DTU_2020_1000418_1_SI_GHA_SEK_038 TaxID=3077585 RepID=UPI0028E1F1E8|nr:hypothetical protein [Bacillus sp. DTU_2020_1000418_1_SI_GHA_SEK_038]WNS74235.1 hypothetical protein RRV45_15095 [Bacillus sp. DTU_2020_1000418_1_SI_GHA_SEK_038]
MVSPKLLYPLRTFELGINDKTAANLIPDQAVVDAENVVFGKGPFWKRNGYVRYSNQLPQPITKHYQHNRFNGDKAFLAVSDKKVYTESNGNLSPITGSLTGSDVQMISYKDRNVGDVVLFADGGKLKHYQAGVVSEVTPHAADTNEQTDPGLNDLANLTNFRALAIKQDRIYAAAHPTVKNRLSFCHHDPKIGYAAYDYWPAIFFTDIATDNNDVINQLEVFRDGLVVLCENSIWFLRGDGRTINDFDQQKINVPTGCIAPNSVKIVGNELFYLAEDGLYAMYSTDQNYVSARLVSTLVSEGRILSSIENTLKSIPLADKRKAVGHYHDNKYYLSFPSGLALVYDTILQCWTKFTNIQANSFLTKEGVLFFASNSGHIYKFDENVYSDDGEAIPFMLKTKNFDFGYEVQDKKYRKFWTIARQYDAEQSIFNLSAKVDYIDVDIEQVSTDESQAWGEGIWGESYWGYRDVVQNELRIQKRGKNIQLIITNNEVDQPLTIYGMTFQYKLKKP